MKKFVLSMVLVLAAVMLGTGCSGAASALHTVTFNVAATATAVSVEDGAKVSKPFDPAAPAGQKFDGWFTAATGGTAYNFSAVVTADTAVYARFSALQATEPAYIDLGGPESISFRFRIVRGDSVIPADCGDENLYADGVTFTDTEYRALAGQPFERHLRALNLFGIQLRDAQNENLTPETQFAGLQATRYHGVGSTNWGTYLNGADYVWNVYFDGVKKSFSEAVPDGADVILVYESVSRKKDLSNLDGGMCAENSYMVVTDDSALYEFSMSFTVRNANGTTVTLMEETKFRLKEARNVGLKRVIEYVCDAMDISYEYDPDYYNMLAIDEYAPGANGTWGVKGLAGYAEEWGAGGGNGLYVGNAASFLTGIHYRIVYA